MIDVELHDRIALMLDRVEGVAYLLGELGSDANGGAEACGLAVLADTLFSEAGDAREALRADMPTSSD